MILILTFKLFHKIVFLIKIAKYIFKNIKQVLNNIKNKINFQTKEKVRCFKTFWQKIFFI